MEIPKESLKIWEACMGPAYHFRGSHCWGSRSKIPLIQGTTVRTKPLFLSNALRWFGGSLDRKIAKAQLKNAWRDSTKIFQNRFKFDIYIYIINISYCRCVIICGWHKLKHLCLSKIHLLDSGGFFSHLGNHFPSNLMRQISSKPSQAQNLCILMFLFVLILRWVWTLDLVIYPLPSSCRTSFDKKTTGVYVDSSGVQRPKDHADPRCEYVY